VQKKNGVDSRISLQAGVIKNEMSAKNFSRDYSRTNGGNPAMATDALKHAYKANPKLRRCNPDCFDLEKHNYSLEFAPSDPVLSFFTGKELVVVDQNRKLIYKDSGSLLEERLGSISVGKEAKLNQGTRYTVGVQQPTVVYSLGKPASLSQTGFGQLLFFLSPMVLIAFGGMIINRIFNGVWVSESSKISTQYNLLPASSLNEPETSQNKLSVPKETFVLKEKVSSDGSSLYCIDSPTDIILYDVIIPLTKEAEVDSIIIKRQVSKLEAEQVVETLLKYGAELVPSKSI
jgi:hypothetical protein